MKLEMLRRLDYPGWIQKHFNRFASSDDWSPVTTILNAVSHIGGLPVRMVCDEIGSYFCAV